MTTKHELVYSGDQQLQITTVNGWTFYFFLATSIYIRLVQLWGLSKAHSRRTKGESIFKKDIKLDIINASSFSSHFYRGKRVRTLSFEQSFCREISDPSPLRDYVATRNWFVQFFDDSYVLSNENSTQNEFAKHHPDSENASGLREQQLSGTVECSETEVSSLETIKPIYLVETPTESRIPSGKCYTSFREHLIEANWRRVSLSLTPQCIFFFSTRVSQIFFTNHVPKQKYRPKTMP